MKIETGNIPECLDGAIKVGNVYRARGGSPTKFWVVFAVRGSQISVLGLDGSGEIVTGQTYGKDAFESSGSCQRTPVGFIPGLADVQLKVTWYDRCC
jgi:hypothetical protein